MEVFILRRFMYIYVENHQKGRESGTWDRQKC